MRTSSRIVGAQLALQPEEEARDAVASDDRPPCRVVLSAAVAGGGALPRSGRPPPPRGPPPVNSAVTKRSSAARVSARRVPPRAGRVRSYSWPLRRRRARWWMTFTFNDESDKASAVSRIE